MARAYRDMSYIEGNIVRRTSPHRRPNNTPHRVVTVNKHKRRGQVMNFGFILFLTVALTVTAFTCISYIRLQSTITSHVTQISSLESQLEELRAANDDMESRIKGSVCLEDVKKRAMEDLGMTYASQDQIIVYESDGTDYVRQFVAIE